MGVAPVSDPIYRQLQMVRSSHSNIKRNRQAKGTANPIWDSSNNIIDNKSETEDVTLGNTFNLIKRWGEGVSNLNMKDAINQKVSDEER